MPKSNMSDPFSLITRAVRGRESGDQNGAQMRTYPLIITNCTFSYHMHYTINVAVLCTVTIQSTNHMYEKRS